MASVRQRRYPSHTSIPILDQPSSFRIDQSELTRLVNEKDFGGVGGILKALNTDVFGGISGEPDDIIRRQNAFGVNTFKRHAKGLFHFLLEAFKDLTHLILLVFAGLSPGLAIRESGLREGWYSGGSSFFSVFLVIVVSAVCKHRQNRRFDQLYEASGNNLFEVIRKGRQQKVSRSKIVVGDVLRLKTGNQVPADGLYIRRRFFQMPHGVTKSGVIDATYALSLWVDELSMTGKHGCLKKNDESPFLFSGTKVVGGDAWILVTAVGMNTKKGNMMNEMMSSSSKETPLQDQLNKLTSSISKVSLVVNFLVIVVLQIFYFTGKKQGANRKQEFVAGQTMGDNIMNSVGEKIAATVTIVSVMIPEGLPIAVTLILAYSRKRMMKQGLMVRKLWDCVPMGSATAICINKTGTLTMNKMEVIEFWVGQGIVAQNRCSKFVLDLIRDGVALNTKVSINERKSSSGSEYEFNGIPTEKAIFSWAVLCLSLDVVKTKKSRVINAVTQMKSVYKAFNSQTESVYKAFNSQTKSVYKAFNSQTESVYKAFNSQTKSGVLIKKSVDDMVHIHWKGVANVILVMCSSFYDQSGMQKDLDKDERKKFKQIIQGMRARGLRCIAFAHKQVCMEAIEEGKYQMIKEDSLTLLGLVGIKELCRPGVKSTVLSLRDARVNIKMITGDNSITAKAIAEECGILRPEERASEGVIVEGDDFLKDMTAESLDKIRVMARSSSSHKRLMVESLKEKEHEVAFAGDGINDARALKEAHIGVLMGIQGIEVAEESSDILIHGNNFFSVVKVLLWGRYIYDNIQKFIQFKLTVNVAALLINFVAAMSSGDVPLTAIQLLWVNLIVDTLGAFALSTDVPTDVPTDLPTDLPTRQTTEQTKELMNRPPVGRTEPLITNVMWRNLAGQAIYQVAILLTLQFKGESIFSVDEAVKRTMIFNAFVLCQVFNEFNLRKLAKMNIFEGIHENKPFLWIICSTVALQVVMVEFLKQFAVTKRLSWGQWGACFGIAAMSWPIAWVVKCIPVPRTPILQLVKKIVQSEQFIRLRNANYF